jgi:hypothetical protein
MVCSMHDTTVSLQRGEEMVDHQLINKYSSAVYYLSFFC